MSAAVRLATIPPSDTYAKRARRASLVLGTLCIAIAVVYAALIVLTEGQPVLLAPLLVALVGLAVITRPIVGVYLLFGAALLFEQTDVPGVAPLTDQSHIWQRLDFFTGIPVPLSIADLLMVLTVTALVTHRVTHRQGALRLGPFGWAVAAYGAVFAVGTVIGIARGSTWNLGATVAEVRAPLHMCVMYFLAANLIRDRVQLNVLVWELVALAGVKALQAIWAYIDGLSLPYALEAVTGHEDVVFFDLTLAVLLLLTLLRVRTRLVYGLYAVLPLIVLAELFTQRRVAFIALGAVIVSITLLTFVIDRRRAFTFALLGAVAVGAYVPLFWDEGGALGEPIRAVRATLDPDSVSVKDLLSDHWREIESRNIEFTLRQLPLTGVGVGQQYLFHEEPPEPDLAYWRYWTHNALLWLWLKAGPLGGFALWLLVSQVLATSASLFVRVRDPNIRWMVALPVLIVTIQIAFSSIDMGLTHSRTMVVLGTVLGASAFLFMKDRSSGRAGEGIAS